MQQAFRDKVFNTGNGQGFRLVGIPEAREFVRNIKPELTVSEIDQLLINWCREGFISLHEHDWSARLRLEGKEKSYLWIGEQAYTGVALLYKYLDNKGWL